uniref:Integrase, catalytic region, zinc finger, CCHC-type, peptidase aspartic, catalytic n=1 Tax=Tanacetum cinerariifolium TaxID=118510 RepID=A0A6L2NIS1_TANCI|nr:hypothetical protein [Tanacetum cinerariifolium]
MIIKSVENGPLIWPSIEENEVIRPKKYYELSVTKAIQADCDVKATNTILQGLHQRSTCFGCNPSDDPVSLSNSPALIPKHLISTTSFIILVFAVWITISVSIILTIQSSTPLSITYPPDEFQSSVHYNVYTPSSSIPQEESRNIDSEIALEKHIKELNNIVFKRNQSAKTVHKAQQLEPKLYDGNVIQKTNAILIRESEETLMLAEESRSKMLLKQKDPMMYEKKVNTKPIDCAVLNQLFQDFETRFVPQIELSAEQAFWSHNSVNSPEPTPSTRPTQVEVPKELPKVSMVNTSLKKLKHHLASFDVVVKERTTATTITEGTWGFEHTKACFRDEIIPFVKALKYLFNSFDQFLVDELFEVQNVFLQMKQVVEQHRVESKTFQNKMNKVLNENERLLEQVISKDVVNIVVTSTVNNAYEPTHECERCVKLETELQKDFIKREILR